ncbi:hypothetical protein IMCC3088_2413 [Aequoribacter fuscus]|uniref:Uncharacterized protein n=1 Tax=Aequoribacter fuscus TaxID=2518989 RepID=F3L432_9GAMM|nr:hypothetical protein IMCC3088_2413 [Aequoribacter fuscus]
MLLATTGVTISANSALSNTPNDQQQPWHDEASALRAKVF